MVHGFNLTEQSQFKLLIQKQNCDYAIQIPGRQYEIGLIKRKDGTYDMVFDHYVQKEAEILQTGYQRQLCYEEEISAGFNVVEEYETEDELILEIEV
jgi:hypothetical protein